MCCCCCCCCCCQSYEEAYVCTFHALHFVYGARCAAAARAALRRLSCLLPNVYSCAIMPRMPHAADMAAKGRHGGVWRAQPHNFARVDAITQSINKSRACSNSVACLTHSWCFALVTRQVYGELKAKNFRRCTGAKMPKAAKDGSNAAEKS